MTVKCYPWTYNDKIALIGDAAHAIVPFYGQGMNAGFEDISFLGKLESEFGNDWEKIFKTFQEKRKPDADAIAELSYRNFLEMSSKTADPAFLLRKKIEKAFADKYPELWKPAYSRVTFSDNSYAEALKEGDRQANIMDEVMKTPKYFRKLEFRRSGAEDPFFSEGVALLQVTGCKTFVCGKILLPPSFESA